MQSRLNSSVIYSDTDFDISTQFSRRGARLAAEVCKFELVLRARQYFSIVADTRCTAYSPVVLSGSTNCNDFCASSNVRFGTGEQAYKPDLQLLNPFNFLGLPRRC